MNADWQPIETAPKDRTVIILAFPDGTTMGGCRWSRTFNSWKLHDSKLPIYFRSRSLPVAWLPMPTYNPPSIVILREIMLRVVISMDPSEIVIRDTESRSFTIDAEKIVDAILAEIPMEKYMGIVDRLHEWDEAMSDPDREIPGADAVDWLVNVWHEFEKS